MIIKELDLDSGWCRTTFTVPAEVGAERAWVCGEFNAWSRATPMQQQPDGSFTATVLLEPGRSYRFRYLLDDNQWENDWGADAYAPNEYGGEDAVVSVPMPKELRATGIHPMRSESHPLD